MTTQDPKVGGKVYFWRGRSLTPVVWEALEVHRTILLNQDEARGTMRSYPVGTKWKVAPNLSKVGEGSTPTMVEGSRSHRTENEILKDIRDCYASLSPENLTCDGELRGKEVARKARGLQARLNGFFKELGRPVSEMAAFQHGSF